MNSLIGDVDDHTKLPIHKAEFINWYLEALKKEIDYPKSSRFEIESSSYAYYRKGDYWKFNSYNVIRGLLACVDLSVQWNEEQFQYYNCELLSKKQNNRLYLTRFSFNFVSYLRDYTNLLKEIDLFIAEEIRKKGQFSQEETFDSICEVFSKELIREFEGFCYSNPNYKYQPLYVYENHIHIVSSYSIVNVFVKVIHQYRYVNNENIMDFIIKYPEVKASSVYSSSFNEYYHVFNFFGKLKERKIGLLTKMEVEKEIEYYCSELKMESKKTLKGTLLNSYFGKKSLLKEISNLFSKTKEVNYLSYETYQKAFCHCIILFEDDDAFQKTFLENKFDKLNGMTSDIVNIYYSEKDVKGKLSGYNIINRFEEESGIFINEENLPAIMVWFEDIKSFHFIHLSELNLSNYFYIIRKLKAVIKQGIKQNNNLLLQDKKDIFHKAIQITKEEVGRLLQKQKEEMKQHGGNKIIGNIGMLQQNFENSKATQNIVKKEPFK
ncbi:hypothetical protein ILS93_27215 [Bacillus sp. 16GRE42]|uniref:hypothetical protein n=1 Tax=Bacillus sp. 16GRE42 TaxID=2778092 RepID=UPI001C9AD287|nr:hypothetical protein [Bacillus sp. 16GRE42]MBY7125744.1 hypothetical protein [Bacillus sp. 16GRE42]